MCDIPECNKPTVGRGWCRKHYMQARRYGDPIPKGLRGKVLTGINHPNYKPVVTYKVAHYRVYAEHGSASNWDCAMQCGRQAGEWAYCHDAETEYQSEFGPYSIDTYDYVPLCISCHRNFDLKARV